MTLTKRRTKKEMLFGIKDLVAKSRVLEGNTLLIEYKDGSKAIRYHLTDIVKFNDGILTLDNGGWKTRTTKDRLNHYKDYFGKIGAGWISQKNYEWFIGGGVFYSGIQFKDGVQISPIKEDQEKERKEMLKRINKYCALVTEDNLPTPNSGDCWHCYMIVKETGKSLGDSFGETEHLLSHMEEGYIPGSLLVNALRENGLSDRQIGMFYSMNHADYFKRSLRKYMVRRLIKQV